MKYVQFVDVPQLVIGLGSILAGANALKTGISGSSGQLAENKFSAVKLPLSALNKKGYKTQIHPAGNIDNRVRYIVKTIQKGRTDPRVRAFAVQAVSRKCGKKWCVPERDWWGEARAVFGAIRENVRYVRDIHNVDTFQAPGRTLEFGGADCDDYTITLGSALQSIGFPIKVRIVQSVDSPDYNHVFALVGLPPRDPHGWYAMDASVNKPAGWHPPKAMLKKIKDYDVP